MGLSETEEEYLKKTEQKNLPIVSGKIFLIEPKDFIKKISSFLLVVMNFILLKNIYSY